MFQFWLLIYLQLLENRKGRIKQKKDQSKDFIKHVIKRDETIFAEPHCMSHQSFINCLPSRGILRKCETSGEAHFRDLVLAPEQHSLEL